MCCLTAALGAANAHERTACCSAEKRLKRDNCADADRMDSWLRSQRHRVSCTVGTVRRVWTTLDKKANVGKSSLRTPETRGTCWKVVASASSTVSHFSLKSNELLNFCRWYARCHRVCEGLSGWRHHYNLEQKFVRYLPYYRVCSTDYTTVPSG